ncbi:MAG: EI24 domain-containing protein [bacterium]|nr:EI24 domain-containing protein [bacterium]
MIDKQASSLISGITAPLQAVRFIIKYPRTIRYCIVPMLIGLVINVLMFIAVNLWALNMIGDWFSFSGAWYVILFKIIVQIIVAGIFLIVMALTYSTVTNIVAGPFHELLSQYVERVVHGDVSDDKVSFAKFVRDGLGAIKEEIIKLLFFLVVQVVLFLLNFVPIAGPAIYLVLNTIVAGYLLSYEYLDLPMSRDDKGFGKKIKYLLNKPVLYTSFGWVCAVLLMIPLVNIVIIPVCVIAGTLLYYSNGTAK